MSDSSIIFAMKMVHVTSEAKASPIMTAFTMMSAERNIDQGDNSCSMTGIVFDGLTVSAAVAFSAEAAGATVAPPGATVPVEIFWSVPAAFCWANETVPIETNISTATVLRTVLNIHATSRISSLHFFKRISLATSSS